MQQVSPNSPQPVPQGTAQSCLSKTLLAEVMEEKVLESSRARIQNSIMELLQLLGADLGVSKEEIL